MTKTFRAYRLQLEDGEAVSNVETLTTDDLPEGDVLIRVHYSSVNYKDAMANLPKNPIIRNYPMIPGIDLAGEVVESNDDRFEVGEKVIATSYDIGVNHEGGYSEYARVKSEWVLPLPDTLSLKQAMLLGTAGLTAAMSIDKLQRQGVTKDKGSILVTGASGGVGSIAVAMLSNLGYNVVASTGKEDAHPLLEALGADSIVDRQAVRGEKLRRVDKETWAGAVDPVGGEVLASILSKLQYNGAVAVSGLTAGIDVPTSVHPFILRGIHLIGIDSVNAPMVDRKQIWSRMANDLKLSNDQFEKILNQEVTLDDLTNILPSLIQNQYLGRIIVDLTNES
ncbi:putative quinone oxidoreductase, YhdH/YhfP family [Pelagirhabdus alkalitolerans]|uniref:Putative quinone oxidoreductase, YhdH/YhfP family n=1 Tax=Pelagirhabdus alkalitolerans TaxID=1612202 RepID=A0A1G6GKT6_9BACI|nr:oxidoreductase [Pelagirhabdus alkalitolerans]SDB82355.1 putative quinone oxidoreductase, YhdH/YhfP family [Pelagirhabdus alkalitolerans]